MIPTISHVGNGSVFCACGLGQATRDRAASFGALRRRCALRDRPRPGAGVRRSGGARQDRERSRDGTGRGSGTRREVPEPVAPPISRVRRTSRSAATPPARAPAGSSARATGSLEVNGAARRRADRRRPGDALRSLDLGPALRPGVNRCRSIVSGSPDGVGGLLFWMDLGSGARSCRTGAGGSSASRPESSRRGRRTSGAVRRCIPGDIRRRRERQTATRRRRRRGEDAGLRA